MVEKKSWIEVKERLPREGQIVSIELECGTIIGRVLFSRGRFWKKRIGENVGQTWNVAHWLPIEKEKMKIESETIPNKAVKNAIKEGREINARKSTD